MGPGFRRDDDENAARAARRTNTAASSFKNHKEFLFETAFSELP
jgi:hypothetical protein